MSDQKTRMIKKAEKMHKKIYPCAEKTHLKDCFTNNKDFLCFWYNTEDHSTHVITEALRKSPAKRTRKKVSA
jgi:hypothetical protein